MNTTDLKQIRTVVKSVVKAEVQASEKRVLKEMGKFVNDVILPQIDEKADKKDVERLERKLDYYGGKTLDHGHRLDTIESLPTVAHELRKKK